MAFGGAQGVGLKHRKSIKEIIIIFTWPRVQGPQIPPFLRLRDLKFEISMEGGPKTQDFSQIWVVVVSRRQRVRLVFTLAHIEVK